jgi:adenylate cyclase
VLATAGIFEFEEFRLDRWGDGLSRRDESGVFVPVPIGSRALDVLSVLVERPGELVTKEEIMGAVWRRSVVENANLTVQIAALRRVLDQGRSEGSCIQTVAVRGYRFVVPVTHIETAASVAGAPRAAPRLSIVVLPFADLSEGGGQQYFADGITDDLTTDLSRIAGMLVISRNSAFTYKAKPVNAKQIGRELSVRYVIEGSVRWSGKQVRVNTQLIDAESDAHLWVERFDRNTGDLFALQDEIARKIAVALDVKLVSTEAARGTDDPDVLDCILRARAAYFRPRTRENYAEMLDLFERALTLDTRSVEAQSYLARTLAGGALDGLTNSPAPDIARAEDLVRRALAASPHNPLALYARGQVLRAQNRIEAAIREYDAVLAIDRNCVDALINLGWGKLWTGAFDEMISCQEQVIRLSPRDPRIGNSYHRIGLAHTLQSRTREAIHWLEKARSASPGLPAIRAWLASAYALNSDIPLAAAELAEARKLSMDGRYSSVARLKAVAEFGVPAVRALFETTYFAGLRKAGVPEE